MISYLELSANGRLLASTGLDGTVRLWDTKTGLQLRRIQTQGASLTTSLSSSGERLAFLRTDSADGTSVATVDLSAGSAPTALNTFGTFRLSADGRWIALGSAELRVVDAVTGAEQKALEPFNPPALAPPGAKLHPAYGYNVITAVAFNEDGTRLAAATGLEFAIIDTTTWKVLFRKRHGMGVPAIAQGSGATSDPFAKTAKAPGPPKGRTETKAPITPDKDPKVIQPSWFPSQLIFRGDSLVLFSFLGARIANAKDGSSIRAVSTSPLSAAILGDALLTTDTLSRVSAWSMATGAPLTIAGLERLRGQRVGVSADGTTIALAAPSSSTDLSRSGLMDLRVYDARTMRLLRVIEPHLRVIEGVAVRPDGSDLATILRDGSLALWSLATGELRSTTRGAPGIGRATIAYDDSGELLLVASSARYVRVHDARTGRVLRQWEPTGQILAAAWFAKGKRALWTLDSAGALKAWDLSPVVALQRPIDLGIQVIAKPAELRSLSIPGPVASAAPSADRTRIAALIDDKIVTTPDPTGKRIFKDAYGESTVTLLDADTGSVSWSTKLISGYSFKWVGFAPDDRSILFSSMDDTRNLVSPDGKTYRTVGHILRVLDGATGAVKRTEKAPGSGPLLASPKAVALAGREAALLDWPSLSARKVNTPDYLVNTVAFDATRGSFVFGGDSGGASLTTPSGDVAAILASARGGDYITTTLDGVFRSSLDGARSVAWTFGSPLEGYSFEQFAARFSRPDIIAARLGGSAPPSPAAVVRPPVVTLERPPNGRSATILTGSAHVIGQVKSATRVDRVRVFVNGRPLAESLVCAPKADIDIEVPIVAGPNRLTVVAYDAEGFASNPEALDVISAGDPSARPDLWTVSVGVSKYKNLAPEQQLDFADDDARSVAAALAAQSGPSRPFGAIHASTLIDEDVTVESVGRALAGLSAMGPNDLAFVFLAGHGVALDGGKMVYLTSAASLSKQSAKEHGVGWDTIRAALGKARGRVVVFLDACHSGHVSTDLIAPNEALAQELSSEGRSGVLVFAAARGSELSYEVPVGKGSLGGTRGLELAWEGKPPQLQGSLAGGHGLFTSALLEALAGQAPDADRSGAVEVGELVDYVTDRVREASNGQQTPWVVRREMFGDFVVAPAAPAATSAH